MTFKFNPSDVYRRLSKEQLLRARKQFELEIVNIDMILENKKKRS